MPDIDSNVTAPHASKPTGPVMPQRRHSSLGVTFDRTAIVGVRQVVVVASGKGGVGKSTVSVNLAVAAALRGKRVGLLDADIYGPSAPTMLGMHAPPEVVAGNKILPVEAHGIKFMSFGLLTDPAAPIIWRGPMIAKALLQFCYDVVWGDLDYLIIDLPPGTGDVQLTLAEKLPIHQALVVTTPQEVALIDARKALQMFRQLDVPVLGVVENMATHRCSQCGHSDAIFGEGGAATFAAEFQVPLLARLPINAQIRVGGDAGVPVATRTGDELADIFANVADILLRS